MRWALCGIKGGVSKSTLATNLAVEALGRGRRVLLVDADTQATSRTWADVATEGGHDVPAVVAMGATMHKPGQLDRVAAAFDLTIIDCPPRANDVLMSALMACDLAVLPCGPSGSDVWATTTTVDLINEARTVRPTLGAVLVIAKRKTNTAIGRGVREALEASGLPIAKTEIFDRVAYQEALSAGQGVGTYAPSTPAAFEVRKLYDELVALGAPPDARIEADSRPAQAVRAAHGRRPRK